MYESVYLYERLKRQTIQESYINSLNTITESCYDVTEACKKVKETMDEIDEATKGRKWSLMERLKRKTNKVKKSIGIHKEKASKTKPIGLSNKKHKNIKSEAELRKVHETAMRYLNQYNINTLSEPQLELFVENVKDNTVYRNLCKILTEGKGTTPTMNVVTDVIEKEISKDDICSAISFLEKDPGEHKDYQACLCATSIEELNRTEKIRKEAYNYKKALVAIVDEAYYDALEKKMDLDFTQANRIMTKAAYYNPRNLRESYEVQDYIDSIFDSYE